MSIAKVVFLLLALVGTTTAQVRAPIKVNICIPVGNSTHSTVTVLSNEVDKYPGYVKGACSKVCSTVCKDSLREVNAAGQCICKGLALKCGANAKASNDKKSCKCLVGFKGDPLKGCVDVDECAAKKPACPADTICTNTVGSFQCQLCGNNTVVVKNECQCKAGFEGDAIAGCTDIDECYPWWLGPKCPADQGCVNIDGSYTCQACGENAEVSYIKCECQYGFEGNPLVKCTDIDECVTEGGHETCARRNRICVNDPDDPGDYSCRRTCATKRCNTDEKCVDTPLGAQCVDFCGRNAFYDKVTDGCVCEDGYTGDPFQACCRANQYYDTEDDSCECLPGFERGWWGECTDIDECSQWWVETCPAGKDCFNTVGAFQCQACGPNGYNENGQCECHVGFELHGDDGCVDTDECVTFGGHDSCAERGLVCVNDPEDPGDYYCAVTNECPRGFELHADDGCVDIDECVTLGGHEACARGGRVCINDPNDLGDYNCAFVEECPPNATLVNGECQCKAGFNGNTLDGCVDIDERVEGGADCDELTVCENTVGSFECNYRCDNWNNCARNEICTDTPDGIQCN